MTTPAVAVLMSVHNGAPWVREAIASVLAQTERDLELIVVDDGSTDDTPAVVAGAVAGEPRVRVVRQAHAGLTRALNRGLALATAPLVARLDADDVARPERLARQRAFLDAHADIGLLGTACREVDAADRELRVVLPPAEDAAIRRALIRRNPFVHSSVMFRRAIATAAGGYDESLAVAQDYDLWMRLSRVTRMANLGDVLVTRRLVAGRVGVARDDDRLRTEARVRWRAVRAGLYPWWCAVFAARAAVALALPPSLRRALRRASAPPA